MTRVVVNILCCDGRDCAAQVPALGDVQVMTMREARRLAAARGWSGGYRGKDFCPRHHRARGIETVDSALLNEVEP